jgi:hypothetical protein
MSHDRLCIIGDSYLSVFVLKYDEKRLNFLLYLTEEYFRIN